MTAFQPNCVALFPDLMPPPLSHVSPSLDQDDRTCADIHTRPGRAGRFVTVAFALF
jgi:hypothetical protein